MGRRDRDRDSRKPKGGLVRAGVRSIAGGIGLASESIKAHRQSKSDGTGNGSTSCMNSEGDNILDHDVEAFDGPPQRCPRSPESNASRDQCPDEKAGRDRYPDKQAGCDQSPDENADGELEDDLEDEWNLDDAQDEIIRESSENGPVPTVGELEDTFLRNYPLPKNDKRTPTGKLALPVALPQRRPKDRSRGFIRAYAPVLENCGIDQVTWLAFLDAFQKSSAANPWLNAINMASFATMALPHGIAMAVGYAIQQVTKIAIELQARERAQVEEVNLTSTIASRSTPTTGLASLQDKYKTSDGVTYGEWEFPEVASLVFPALDQLAAQTSGDAAQKKSGMAEKLTFVANYWDKRATAEYAGQNPDSVLARVPQTQFKSRYADPNNPAASGSLISFVSGGHLVPGPNSRGLVGGIVSVVGQAMRGVPQGTGRGAQYYDQQYNNQQYRNQYSRDYVGRSRRRGRNNSDIKTGLISNPIGVYKKLLKKHVLYLMVVNMPSDEEMAAAKAAVPP